ncbi:MAG: hypothetical protein LW854_21335 [Rubrivivax sp.]|jgi:hypothetical protein|nr:hypothetical protein [Rubrivivax sp.]
MTLREYLKSLPDTAAREAFALRCGTSLGYLRLVSYGHKTASESLALRVQAESGNAVQAAQLLPSVDFSFVDRLQGADSAAATGAE